MERSEYSFNFWPDHERALDWLAPRQHVTAVGAVQPSSTVDDNSKT